MTVAMGLQLATRAGGAAYLQPAGEHIELRLSAEEHDASYAVVRTTTPPGGGALALHAHPQQETFIVLEGCYEFGGLGEEGPYTFRAGPGAIVQIAADAPHSYRNVGPRPGRMLVIYTSAAPQSGAFLTIGLPVAGEAALGASQAGPPSVAALLSILEGHGAGWERALASGRDRGE